VTIPERREPFLPNSLRGIIPAIRLFAFFLPAIFLLAISGFVSPLPAAAGQKPYALIFVDVFLSDGRAAYGVPVKVRRADKKKTLMEAPSDHLGEVAFRVPPGPADYIVWADIKPSKKKASPDPVGAKSQADEGIEVKVHVDADERADIALHLPQSFKPY